MLMKITKLYFLMALALLSGGCKGWLTIDSSDRIMENTLFETEEGFFTALNGVYAELPQASLYGKSLAAVTFDVQAQYFDTTQPSTHTFNTLGAYSAEARKTAVADTWDKAYFVIANVNNALLHENKLIEAAVQEPASRSTKSSDIGILIGFFMIILGLFHLLAPAKAWKLEIGWQFKDAEPSKAALMFHRVIGGLLIIGAIVVIVIFHL